MAIYLEPIGYVSNFIGEPIHEGWEDIRSYIDLRPELSEALDGIEDFSHIIVIFWLHRVSEEKRHLMKLHPKDRAELPEVGVLATRSQYRPNPIGLTVVRLLRRDGSRLEVQGLDAVDGTPVLDIKPWTPWETSEQVRWPWWMDWLRQRGSS